MCSISRVVDAFAAVHEICTVDYNAFESCKLSA